MTKAEFLTELSQRLGTLHERERFMAYYDEMLSDRMEDGMDEAAAVASLEPIPVIAQRIMSEAGPTAQPAPKKTKLGAASVALITLGSPLWAPLLMAVAMVALALVIVLWALWFSLAAVCVSLLAVGVAGMLGMVVLIFSHPASSVFMLGMGVVCAALGLMCYRPLSAMTVWTKQATAKVMARVRSMRKKEVA